MLFKGTQLASASQDKTILIWDTNTRTCIRRLRGHAAAVYCLDAEGDVLVSGSADKTILTWKFSTGESLTTIKGHKGTVYCLKLVGNILVSGSADRTIKVRCFALTLKLVCLLLCLCFILKNLFLFLLSGMEC